MGDLEAKKIEKVKNVVEKVKTDVDEYYEAESRQFSGCGD